MNESQKDAALVLAWLATATLLVSLAWNFGEWVWR
jgi:hypothetical protein